MTPREEAQAIFNACKAAYSADNEHHAAIELSLRNLNAQELAPVQPSAFDWELRAVGAEAALKTVEGQRDGYRDRLFALQDALIVSNG